MQQVTFAGQTYTVESLHSLSTATLVGLYNSVSPGKPVRRFENRTTAVSRVWKVLVDWQASAAIQEAIRLDSSPVGQEADSEPLTEPAKAIKPTSQVQRLLEVFRQHPDGIDLSALSSSLGADSKRVRGLIDSARARGTKIAKVDGVKSMWRLTLPLTDTVR